MPRKKHESHAQHTDRKESGFIANDLTHTMNKNEKIIMGILVGGIVIFLALSIIILFGKGKEKNIPEFDGSTIKPSPTRKVIITPYPTVPPITDFTMQVNEREWYPDTVSITHGHQVTIINIGKSETVIEKTGEKDLAIDFGTIAAGEEKSVSFKNPGVYTYTRKNNPKQILTITVK